MLELLSEPNVENTETGRIVPPARLWWAHRWAKLALYHSSSDQEKGKGRPVTQWSGSRGFRLGLKPDTQAGATCAGLKCGASFRNGGCFPYRPSVDKAKAQSM